MTHFEKQGLFLGLLSYPYNYDGKELYKKLKTFFDNHKNNLWKYETNSRANNISYKPAGYRMFGSQGLAILSIVDDYTFYNRHFNKNHIQSCIDCDDDLVFNTTVISGITETDDENESCLIEKAKNTFLRDNNRYHFIGIIRVKINPELLLGEGRGVDTLRKIRRCINNIENKCKDKNKANADHISIDCYDNDEITVIAFSDNMLYLYNFLGEIRSITNNAISVECEEMDETTKQRRLVEKHVFGSALLCFGYDVTYDPSNDSSIENIKMRCLIETKAGHRDALFAYLSDFLGKEDKDTIRIEDISKNITGGCNVVATLPLNKIIKLEEICQSNNNKKDNVFLRDVRRMKVVLMDINNDTRFISQVGEDHASSKNYTEFKIKKKTISDTKDLMKEIGISKLVRERLMALYELYNNSCQNLLQQFYLQELQKTMTYFYDMIKGMKGRNEKISDMEDALNKEIGNMENAIYDRLHIQKHNQPPLEYSGGIQQYLTSFDYAYKYICNVFSPNEVGYVTITGAERASSARCLFNLNINDIVFPELFITTAWKEVANFAIKFLEKPKNNATDKYGRSFFENIRIWHDFSQNKESFNVLKYNIIHSDKILPNDKTCEIVMELMKEELLMYFFKDYLVFHFAFLRNYKMMWHYYFKIMLQTSICYIQLNEINRKHLVHLLLRLFMVGLLSDEASDREFISKQASKPFDYILGDMWLKDYNKTLEIAKVIYSNLEHYGFKNMNDSFILIHENNNAEIPFIKDTFDYLKDSKEDIINRLVERKSVIKTMVDDFNRGVLITNSNKETKDYIICMFYAYLDALYELDKHDRPIKSIHRDIEGKVPEFVNDYKDNYNSNGMNVLIDPTGGFFIPSFDVREKYFQLRTVLYRSLWNYRYTNEK